MVNGLKRCFPGAAWIFGLAPALLAALLLARAIEIFSCVQTGGIPGGISSLILVALGFDLLCFLKYLPGFLLIALPVALFIQSARTRVLTVGILWSLIVIVQIALIQFFLTTRQPLGADLFGYSWRDIHQSVAGGARMNIAAILGFFIPLAGLWFVLAILSCRPSAGERSTLVLLGVSLVALIAAPSRSSSSGFESQYVHDIALNKGAYFVEQNLAYLFKSEHSGEGTPGIAGFRYLDPAYPFLHAEQTPDVLGPFFKVDPARPPNIVFIIVEGLGRSFSGPDADLGSFTPFLDELASRSISFDNFLAVQGRTFAVLPSILGSLPFGEKGFNALGERMPPHVTLPSLLKDQGYRLKFYGGFDLDFDNERAFLSRQGMDLMVGVDEFGPKYPRSPGNGKESWGYADLELMSRVMESESLDTAEPFVSIIQTMTMHTPYGFPGQDRYAKIFETHLDRIGIPAEGKERYRAFSDMYTSILYTDNALKHFFAEFAKDSAYANTIFVITGDHRLPEIPLSTQIDRYHVPLIIASPLLKAPARIRSMSSHLDLAPSLLAFLSNHFGIKTPAAVTWLSSGLDMEPSFRNIHEHALKQTVTNLVDFISDTWYLNQGTLYSIGSRMNIEKATDDSALAMVNGRFARFQAANDRFERDLALLPEAALKNLAAYNEENRLRPAAPVVEGAVLEVSDILAPPAKAGNLRITITFKNSGVKATEKFVPLVVLLAADGRQISESYGSSMLLLPGTDTAISLPVKASGARPGQYFMAVFPSHPETGKKVGAGRYHVPILIRG